MARSVGFFRELPHGDREGPSLRDSVGLGSVSHRAILHRYLASGAVLAAASALAVDDILDSRHRAVAPLNVLTDGIWVWPADLAYYVATYDVELPDLLVERIIDAKGICPQVGDDELIALAECRRVGD